MKAAIVTAAGQTPAFGDFADPVPAAGEALVRVTAAALSPLTRGRASGAHYSSSGTFPFVAGVDGVGRLDDGRRVYFVLPRAPNGAMAERTAVPIAHCVPLPDGLDDVTAAAIANPGMSSWAAFTERAKLKAGETVLINGATGMSGQLAVRIARHFGAGKVIATGRDIDTLQSLGADAIIPLKQDEAALDEDFKAQFAQGVDVVIDYLWGTSAERMLIAAAKTGAEAVPLRFVQVGAASGADIRLPGAVLRSSAIELMGSGIGSITLERLVAAVGGVLGAAAEAGLSIPVEPVPLAQVESVWGKDTPGRVVFTIVS
jgi:NADPH:quinone reductase-like Zn-dependent oxidoreductase